MDPLALSGQVRWNFCLREADEQWPSLACQMDPLALSCQVSWKFCLRGGGGAEGKWPSLACQMDPLAVMSGQVSCLRGAEGKWPSLACQMEPLAHEWPGQLEFLP